MSPIQLSTNKSTSSFAHMNEKREMFASLAANMIWQPETCMLRQMKFAA